jgi:CRP-like cAMP-binding protein
MAIARSSTMSTGSLPDEAKARLRDLAATAAYMSGDVVLHEGAAVPFLGVVESGRVALRIHVPGRGTVTIVTIEPGELIGWSAVVPPFRATSGAVALEPTRITAYEAESLRLRLDAEPALAAAVLPAVLAGVSDRLTTSWHQLLDLFGGTGVEPW